MEFLIKNAFIIDGSGTPAYKGNVGIKNGKIILSDLPDTADCIIDAEGKSLGRVAVAAASILRGKIKPTFTPNVDCGDFVIILNADKVVLTGKKLDQKYYRYHTGYVGGLKEIKYKQLMAEKPKDWVIFKSTPILPQSSPESIISSTPIFFIF